MAENSMVTSALLMKGQKSVMEHRSMIDPVGKYRVSEPGNLIDTDFEYGLQTTRWETLELINNIPAFYSRSNDETIPVETVNVFEGSYNVIVRTVDDHNLTVGTPIIIFGVNSFSCEGGFIVTKVIDTKEFIYKANEVQTFTKDIYDNYSTYLFAAKFYQGTSYTLDQLGSIKTDGQFPSSKIIVDTKYPHGFSVNSAFVMGRSVGTKTLSFDANKVDPRETITETRQIDLGQTLGFENMFINKYVIPFDWQGKKHNFFDLVALDNSDTFTIDAHGYMHGDLVLYVTPIGDIPIIGLDTYGFYEVDRFSPGLLSNQFKLNEPYTNDTQTAGLTGAYTGNWNRYTSIDIWTGSQTNVKSLDLSTFYMRYGYQYTESYQSYEVLYYQSYCYRYCWTYYYWYGWYQYCCSSGSSPVYGYRTRTRTVNAYHRVYCYVTKDGVEKLEGQYYTNNYWTYASNWLNTVEFDRVGEVTKIRLYLQTATTSFIRMDAMSGTIGFNRRVNVPKTGLTSIGATEFSGKHGFLPANRVIDCSTSTVTIENADNTDFNAVKTYMFSKSFSTPGYLTLQSNFNGFSDQGGFSQTGFSNIGQNLNSFWVRRKTTTGSRGIESNFTVTGDNTLQISFYGFANRRNYNSVAVFTGSNNWNPTTTAQNRVAAYVYNNNSSARLYLQGFSTGTNVAWTMTTNQWYTLQLVHSQTSSQTVANVFLGQDTVSGTPVASQTIADYIAESEYKIGFGASNEQNRYYAALYKFRSTQSGLKESKNNYNATEYHAYNSTSSRSGLNVIKNMGQQFMTLDFDIPVAAVTSTLIANQNSIYDVGNPLRDGYSLTFANVDTGSLPAPLETDVTYYVNMVDANRFRLKENVSTGSTIDLQSYGGGLVEYTTVIENPNKNTIFAPGHSLTDGTEVKYNANGLTPIGGLTDTSTYFVYDTTDDRFRLTSTWPTVSAIDLTTTGNDLHYFSIDELGSSDGTYFVSTVPDPTTLILDAPFQIPFKEMNFLPATTGSVSTNIFFIPDHRMPTGASVTYTRNADSADIGGLADTESYFVIRKDPHNFWLVPTFQDAVDNTNIVDITSLPNNGIAHTFTTDSIGGEVLGSNVDIVAGSTTVVADATTRFTNTYKVGDILKVVVGGSVISKKILDILSDTKLTVETPFAVTASVVPQMLSTAFYVKVDGLSLHRPYDGGVELIPSKNSDAQLIRQTRRYFRYQSGKGIQISLAVNFSAPVEIMVLSRAEDVATVTTRRPHRLSSGLTIVIENADDPGWNGEFEISTINDIQSFSFFLNQSRLPQQTTSGGIPLFYVKNWTNSLLRCGLYDEQNGVYFEYNGEELFACRRSSVQQLPGYVSVEFNSPIITGENTNFMSQLTQGDKVVVKGQSYKVVEVTNNTLLYVQPVYRGASQANVIMTLTVDTKVPQSQWSEDHADGTGATGYFLDINRIQMVYMDYSWYGAGKVRLGCKDNSGEVKYLHSFIHNNLFNEAYFRSGNLPSRYEVQNIGKPSYTPALMHWGTSVIMDGKFDADGGYLFTGSGQVITYSNGDFTQFTANYTTTNQYYRYYTVTQRYIYPSYRLDVSSYASVSNLKPGTIIQGTNIRPGTKAIDISRSGNSAYVYIDKAPTQLFSGVTITAGEDDVLPNSIPLISIRLAPSADNSRPGLLGQREIVNRMQMILKTVGILTTHDTEIRLVLNGSIDNKTWERVTPPSLAQVVRHGKEDQLVGGTVIFSLRVQGGPKSADGSRSTGSETYTLDDLVSLGNSILGGDGVFPDGPDLLTIDAACVASDVSAVSPYTVTARITWSESQA